jgi:hypothetical protein
MRVVTTTLSALVLLLLSGSTMQAQQQKPATCADWFAVQSWTGTLTYSGSGSGSDAHGNSESIAESATINFTTAKNTSPCDINGDFSNGPVSWDWSATTTTPSTYRVTVNDSFTTQSTDGSGKPCTSTITWDAANATSANGMAQVDATFTSATSGTHTANATQLVDGVTEVIQGCGGSSTQTVVGYQWGPSTYPPNGVALPTLVGPLSASRSFTAPGGLGEPIHWIVTWSLTPNINWDVVLRTSPDYATWRPQAGKSETDVSAGLLGANVFIVDKDTGQSTAMVSVDGWTVELKDVSHEPGVSMNYPPKNKLVTPTPADLDFKDVNEGIFPNTTVSEDGLTLTATPNPATGNQLVFFMNSRDWGGWGTLNITTTLAGQTFKAHFEGDETTDILLPKRQAGSFIADDWKTQHNIPLETADSDDSETQPVGLPGCIGDGLTLYEEYRGFMEKGQHIEGDPTKKDFFVENRIGGDAKPGIRLFQSITNLNVHKDLRPDEMDVGNPVDQGPDGPNVRLINFNHGQGAHEVDQHGVAVLYCVNGAGVPTNGGDTILNRPGVRGRPKLTNSVCLQLADGPGSLSRTNTHGGSDGVPSITPAQAAQQYDIGVAHELGHSIGAEHHGEGDLGAARFEIVGPGDPRNTSGKPQFTIVGASGVGLVSLLDETTGVDRAKAMWDKVSSSMPASCGGVSSLYSPSLFSSVCQGVVGGILSLYGRINLYIGVPHGQESGSDQCVMRYFFASTYPSASSASVYYVIAPGSEPLGRGMCSSATGTGVNAPGRQPQPRYLDAAPNRGACKAWLCVNDKYPPVAQ